MAAPWQNADGLTVKFGNYYSDPKNFVNKPLALTTAGAVRQIEIDFDLTKIPNGTVSYADDLNNDGTLDGWSDEHACLPANAAIVTVRMVFTVAAAGGTSWTVGTYRQTGAAVAATGLMTATEGVTANGVIGGRINGAGSLTSSTAAGVGSNNVWIGIATTGTFTAGSGRLIVDYIDTLPEAYANT